MPEQVMARTGDRLFLVTPQQDAEIQELRDQGLPYEAEAILLAVAEKLALFTALMRPPDEGSQLIGRGCDLAAGECYKAALEMAREVVGE